jgi:hypothetical protein
MAHPHHHALSSARKFGGKAEDYQHIHDWFDATKELVADFRHRALRHHTHGIFEAERLFGTTLINSDGKEVPVRFIAEQHVREDCMGAIPTPQDWLQEIPVKPWMVRPGKLSGNLSKELSLPAYDGPPPLTL